ncbi:hypothetical protein GLOIN_2v1886499 [Rhizophagus irregularis DAOM 181602=DAOM 197198]|nr:hypothetical protein GLOIN_2v1886499 [Rhizophagus irregularis DAOM 181602=DAOM 197198]
MDINFFPHTTTVVCTENDWTISVHTTPTVVNKVKNKNPAFNGHVDLKLHRARQHRFLFLPSQYINKPIQHLKYHKRLVLRDEEHYNFPIPPASPRPLGAIAVMNRTFDQALRSCPGNNSISTSNTHSPATTSQPILLKEEKTWHETLASGFLTTSSLIKRKKAHELAVRLQKEHEAREVKRLAYEEELFY